MPHGSPCCVFTLTAVHPVCSTTGVCLGVFDWRALAFPISLLQKPRDSWRNGRVRNSHKVESPLVVVVGNRLWWGWRHAHMSCFMLYKKMPVPLCSSALSQAWETCFKAHSTWFGTYNLNYWNRTKATAHLTNPCGFLLWFSFSLADFGDLM